mgnify:FL=1
MKLKKLPPKRKEKVQFISNISECSDKLHLDKYYTDTSLAKYCIDKTFEVIGEDNITDIIEPSAGNGSFSLQLPKCTAYDIEPEHPSIIKQDFLKLDINYLKGRLIIGNPPFGSRMGLAQKFYKKSVELCDYIAFILPISQLDNSSSLYQFDLIYSEDLGIRQYSDREIHCCFNIYKRPNNGLNSRKNLKLKDITIVRQDSKGYKDFEYDVRMCYWGNATAGKILSEGESYSAEYKIKINSPALKDEILQVLSSVNWKEELNSTAMLSIRQFHIAKVLKKYISNIK